MDPETTRKNGYIEFFNRKPTYELLDREMFKTLFEPQKLIGNWGKVLVGLNRITLWAMGYQHRRVQ